MSEYKKWVNTQKTGWTQKNEVYTKEQSEHEKRVKTMSEHKINRMNTKTKWKQYTEWKQQKLSKRQKRNSVNTNKLSEHKKTRVNTKKWAQKK